MLKLASDRILTSAPRCPAIFPGLVSPWVKPSPKTVAPLQPTASSLNRRPHRPCHWYAALLLMPPLTSSRALLCLLSRELVRTSPISSTEDVNRRPATCPERKMRSGRDQCERQSFGSFRVYSWPSEQARPHPVLAIQAENPLTKDSGFGHLCFRTCHIEKCNKARVKFYGERIGGIADWDVVAMATEAQVALHN